MSFHSSALSVAGMLIFLVPLGCSAQSAESLLQDAQKAWRAGQKDRALDLANKAVAQDPKDTSCLAFRAIILDKLDMHEKTLGDLTKLIELDPKRDEHYNTRGAVQFKLGRFSESVKDFNKYVELKPSKKASHWQRGISFYYAGQYDEGRQQFEGYQTYDSNDVENAVWRFMCMAKSAGLVKARQDILKIGDDKRVPMRQVYDLFAGKLKPDDVLAAAAADKHAAEKLNEQLFYAHLYVGIYYDLEGDRKKAFTHLNKATDDYRIGHYMWDVARVHRDLLKKELDKK